jgi:DNA oxidative demethylase
MMNIRGFAVWPGYLDTAAQLALVEDVRGILLAAPLVAPVTPGGRQMSGRINLTCRAVVSGRETG